MASYIIQGETLKAIADEVRDLTGISEEINPNEMVTNIGQANADVEAQTGIIGQIKMALDGKTQSGGGLPDWDDDSPIVASGSSYYTNNIVWELTEKGTFRWKVVDFNDKSANGFTAGFGGSSLAQIPLDYQEIALKVKQMYAEDGIKSLEFFYAVNCERFRLPNTLTKRAVLLFLPSVKEADFSGDLFSTLASYQCNQWVKLEKVILSPLLTTLPDRAFAQCYSLKEINLENVTAFNSACFLEDFTFDSEIVFNPNLTSVGAQAFYRTRITSVKFQNSADNLPTIANNAFGHCRALTDIYCPWAEGAVANAPWGCNATIHYNTEV